VINDFIAPATLRRDCDWGLGIEDMWGPQIVNVLLPEFNASRSFARILAMQTRLAIADGNYDRALEYLRMIYRLAQNIGSERLLVCGLIGIADASIANQALIELIAAKDSPNLYWALAELPEPIVDIRNAVRFDLSMGLRMFPSLLDAETAVHTPEEWARILTEAFSALGLIAETNSIIESTTADFRQAAVATWSIVLYPSAKQRLLDSGMPKERIDSMPVGQVIAIDTIREYRRFADSLEKWLYVPYHIRHMRHRIDELAVSDNLATQSFGRVLALLLLPSVDAASSAEARVVWQMRALQIVEALRIHAAEFGELPATLDQITAVPVPLNPATNQPYKYRLDGSTAILELPLSDGFYVGWRFEISLASER
jgi:hypothetical protein